MTLWHLHVERIVCLLRIDSGGVSPEQGEQWRGKYHNSMREDSDPDRSKVKRWLRKWEVVRSVVRRLMGEAAQGFCFAHLGIQN